MGVLKALWVKRLIETLDNATKIQSVVKQGPTKGPNSHDCNPPQKYSQDMSSAHLAVILYQFNFKKTKIMML